MFSPMDHAVRGFRKLSIEMYRGMLVALFSVVTLVTVMAVASQAQQRFFPAIDKMMITRSAFTPEGYQVEGWFDKSPLYATHVCRFESIAATARTKTGVERVNMSYRGAQFVNGSTRDVGRNTFGPWLFETDYQDGIIHLDMRHRCLGILQTSTSVRFAMINRPPGQEAHIGIDQ